MISKRFFQALALLTLIAVALSACAPAVVPTPTPVPPTRPPAPTATPIPPTPTVAPTATPTSGYPMTVTDGAGRTVTIAKAPQRIISLAPSNTEILFALGLGDRVAGVTKFCNYPLEATKKPQVGGFSDVNVEKVVELQPDLVLAASLHIPEVVPKLEKLGLTVMVLDAHDLPGVLKGIQLVGKIAGQEKAAETITSQMQRRADAVAQAVKGRKRPRVYWELDNTFWTAGPGSLVQDLIERAGGENIAANAKKAWVQLTAEAIITANPEVIVLADHPFGESAKTVASRPGWGAISAVANKRIVELTQEQTDIVSRPGPRVVDALELIARAFHPDAFK